MLRCRTGCRKGLAKAEEWQLQKDAIPGVLVLVLLVLFLFEDAHWSDPSSVELLDAVIERVPDLPVLLVVSFRSEFVAP
jgi:hypothetical protein